MVLYFVVAVGVFCAFPLDVRSYWPAFNALVFVGVFLSVAGMATGYWFIGLNKNGIASSLACCFLVGVELMLSAPSRVRRQVLGLALLVIAAGLLFSLSRGAWLGTIAGVVFIFALRRRLGLLLRISLALLPLLIIFWLTLPQASRDYATGFGQDHYNIKMRYQSIDLAENIFYQSPIYGMGVGLRKDYDATNILLMTLAETGVLGAAALLLIHFAYFRMIWSAQKRVARSEALFSLLCIGGALVLDKFVHGMVDHYWSRGAIMAAWASAGMATRAYYVAQSRVRAPSEDWAGLVMRGGTGHEDSPCLFRAATGGAAWSASCSNARTSWPGAGTTSRCLQVSGKTTALPSCYRQVPSYRRPDFLRCGSYFESATWMARGMDFDVLNTHGVVCPTGGVQLVHSLHRAWLERSRTLRGPLSAARWRQNLNPLHPTLLGLEAAPLRRAALPQADRADPAGQGRFGAVLRRAARRRHRQPERLFPGRVQPRAAGGAARGDALGLGLAPEQTALLFVANELERKGYPALLSALRQLGDPNVRLLVVGNVDAGEVGRRAAEAGVGAQVVACGPTRDVAGFHAAADLFVLPTQYEAFCLAILEALGSGLPVVTTRVPGAQDAVLPNVNGALVSDRAGRRGTGGGAEAAAGRRDARRALRRRARLRHRLPVADRPGALRADPEGTRPMRIALSYPGCHRRGGIERVVLESTNYLAGCGHEVHLYAADWDRDALDARVTVHAVPLPLRGGLPRLISYARRSGRLLAAARPPADVHGSFGVESPLGGVMWVPSVHKAWLEASRTQRDWRGRLRQKANLNHPLLLSLERAQFTDHRYRRLLALTPQVKADLIRFYDVPDGDIAVLPNGYSPAEFSAARRRRLARPHAPRLGLRRRGPRRHFRRERAGTQGVRAAPARGRLARRRPPAPDGRGPSRRRPVRRRDRAAGPDGSGPLRRPIGRRGDVLRRRRPVRAADPV